MKNKSILIAIIIVIVVVIVTSVFLMLKPKKNNATEKEQEVKDILNNNIQNDSKDNANKILVVYFSVIGETYNVGNVEVGNTAMMASYIKEYLEADSFEIVPTKAYTKVYSELTTLAKEEQKNNARPEIKNKIDNFADYDTIFIGYPIWWGDLPQILYTFLESYNFDGKKIIPFNTHEGSGSSGTYNILKNKLNGGNVNTNGLALTGKNARTDEGKTKTIEWLKDLGY